MENTDEESLRELYGLGAAAIDQLDGYIAECFCRFDREDLARLTEQARVGDFGDIDPDLAAACFEVQVMQEWGRRLRSDLKEYPPQPR